ncbi:MAG: hypothetical protein HY053_04865 [Proteobacteria bacterium]|nr:hypothetical protein [Pseudomonadota bacterium]
MNAKPPGFDPTQGAGGAQNLVIELDFIFLRQSLMHLEVMKDLGKAVTVPVLIVDALGFLEKANSPAGTELPKLGWELREQTTLYEEVGNDGFPCGEQIRISFHGENALRLDRLRAQLRLPSCKELAMEALTTYRAHLWRAPEEAAANTSEPTRARAKFVACTRPGTRRWAAAGRPLTSACLV